MITACELHKITGKVIGEDDLFDGIPLNKMMIIIEAMANAVIESKQGESMVTNHEDEEVTMEEMVQE